MVLEFSTIIKSNQDYGLLMTKAEWSVVRTQLSKEELARLDKGEAVEYKDSELRKVKK